ncbi:MAG: polymerase subunit sigma-24 [Labilithrix sp.]|nr:polymerase subunit sigma-24 [Labilithrix sp.]
MEVREETALLEAARGGDEASFQRLVLAHRSSLRAHCYRFLGSMADADDALQEALLGAWQGIGRFEGRSSLRTWLFTISTHACMRFASRRPGRLSPIDRAPPADPRAALPEPVLEAIWLEAYPDDPALSDIVESPEARYAERESIELAFVAALQLLPATQRAVLVLRDVLGFSAQETAEALDTSVASANSALQRARETIERRVPDPSQAANKRSLGVETHRRLVEDFIAAWSRADVDRIVTLLSEDATFTMPPLPCWFRGSDALRVFLAERVFALKWRFLATSANGQPAMAAYQWDEASGTYQLDVLNVLELRGDRVAGIHAFLRIGGGPFALAAVWRGA